MLTYADPSAAAAAGWLHGRLLLRFLRVRNAKLPLTVFLLVGIDHRAPSTSLILGTVLIVLVYGFVVVFNDIHDVVGDRINNRDLPLATGEVSDAEAVGNAYCEDGKIFPSNKKIIKGREPITEYWNFGGESQAEDLL